MLPRRAPEIIIEEMIESKHRTSVLAYWDVFRNRCCDAERYMYRPSLRKKYLEISTNISKKRRFVKCNRENEQNFQDTSLLHSVKDLTMQCVSHNDETCEFEDR